jgi:hypothetical protein
MTRHLVLAMAICTAAGCLAAEKSGVFTDPAKAGPEFAMQGEYKGELKADDQSLPIGAQVVALGDGKFHGVFYFNGLPGDGWTRNDNKVEADSETVDGAVTFTGDGGSAKIVDGKMKVFNPTGDPIGMLEKVERKSPTLGAKPPEGAKVLFDGSSTEQWINGKIGEGKTLLATGARTKEDFQDFALHIEFRTPFVPAARGQERGNSGVYLQNRYEIQVLDSFGLEGLDNECGGFYSIRQPEVNMCYPPLSWQTYDVNFTAARFEGENKTKNARVTVKHNGVTIFDDFELPRLTPGGASTEVPGKGPILLQAHGNPVTYRNIWVLEKKS